MNNFSTFLIPIIGFSLFTLNLHCSNVTISNNNCNIYYAQSTVEQEFPRSRFNIELKDYSENLSVYHDIGNTLNSAAYFCTEGENMPDYIKYDYLHDLINEFISIIRFEDDDDYTSSEFLSEKYETDSSLCIELIKKAIEFDSYKYAKEILTAIRFSDINYFDKWFKNILIDCMHVEKIKNVANNFYLLYEETFDII